jgi:hypothetical protein
MTIQLEPSYTNECYYTLNKNALLILNDSFEAMERHDVNKLVRDTMATLRELKHNTAVEHTKWTFALTDAQKLDAFAEEKEGLAKYPLTVAKPGDMYQFITEYNKTNNFPPFETQAYFAVRRLNAVVFLLVADTAV